MANIDNSHLWTIELHIADLDERIRVLEANGADDALTARKVARLKFERNAEVRRRDLCIMTLFGADYVFTPSFTERWHRTAAAGDPVEPMPEDASFGDVRRRRRA